MSVAAAPSSAAVPCLAGLYLALGADAAPLPRAVSPARRLVAGLAAGALALSVAAWPAASAVTELLDRPAATLPEWPDLAPGDAPGLE